MVQHKIHPEFEGLSGFEAAVAVGHSENYAFAKLAVHGTPHRLDRDFADPNFVSHSYSQHDLTQEERDSLWDPYSELWMLRLRTPLRVCAMYGAHELAEWFLERSKGLHGSSDVPARPDHFGWIAMREAIWRNDLRMLALLLAESAPNPADRILKESGHVLLSFLLYATEMRRRSSDLAPIKRDQMLVLLKDWGADPQAAVRIAPLKGIHPEFEQMTAEQYAEYLQRGLSRELFE